MYALKSSRVVTADGVKPAVILVDGETIHDVVHATGEVPVTDLGDTVLMAGLVDCHVHINEPGRTEWEGFETATRAAASGGVTTLVDMPLNSSPVTTTKAALELKGQACEHKLAVDVGLWGGVVPGNAGELSALIESGALGAKGFLCHSGIDDFPNVTREDLVLAMRALEKTGAPLLVHAELESAVELPGLSERDYRLYLASRPKIWEDAAIALTLGAVRETGCPAHIVHLSSATALPMIADAKEEGLPITVETCPHYLCLSAEEVPEGDTSFKCAPPIREASNRDALWQGLRDGIIDLVVTDHSPCVPALKLPERGDFMEAWGGIASLGLGLSAVWTEAQKRGFAIEDIARWMCARPAAHVGLGNRKGKLAKGFDADIVAWDPEASFVVDEAALLQRHKITPYRNRTLNGVVKQTWLRGDKPGRGQLLLGRKT